MAVLHNQNFGQTLAISHNVEDCIVVPTLAIQNLETRIITTKAKKTANRYEKRPAQ